jgi:hypothetical protein
MIAQYLAVCRSGKTPVMWTLGFGQSATRKQCKKTQSTINVRLLAGTGGFWTGQAIPVSNFLCSGVKTESGDWDRGTPSRSQGVHDGGVLRSWELPQRFAIGGGGRTDIESPLGRHQGGLRNTLCHCLLMNHLVRLRSRGEDVLQECPGLAVEVIPVIDLGVCLGHKARGPSGRDH